MRAFAVQSFGETPAIHELAIPAADGAFLIRVRDVDWAISAGTQHLSNKRR